ncbi:MAG: hypothetical protein ACRDY7_02135, partial [Acidimicrobiia bacterium]
MPMEVVVPLWQSMSATAKWAGTPTSTTPSGPSASAGSPPPPWWWRAAADGFLPRAHPEAYVAGIPDARLEVVDGAG